MLELAHLSSIFTCQSLGCSKLREDFYNGNLIFADLTIFEEWWFLRFVACLKVKVDRVENLEEEHCDKVAMMRWNENIENLIKVALT